MSNYKQWEDEYKMCHTSADYEAYIRRYYNTDNPWLQKAKGQLTKSAHAKANDEVAVKNKIKLLLLGILVLAAAVGLMFVSFTQDGKSGTAVYHGQNIDFKYDDPIVAILGPGAMIASIALFIFSIYILYQAFTNNSANHE